jgi:hypothetical protein
LLPFSKAGIIGPVVLATRRSLEFGHPGAKKLGCLSLEGNPAVISSGTNRSANSKRVAKLRAESGGDLPSAICFGGSGARHEPRMEVRVLKSLKSRRNSPAKKPTLLPKPIYRQQYGLIVICADERNQTELYKRLVRIGLKPRVVTT